MMNYLRRLLSTIILIIIIIIAPITTLASAYHTNVVLSSDYIPDAPFAFQAGHGNSTWSGFLNKRSIRPLGENHLTITNESLWDASALLTYSQAPAHRTIITFDATIKQTVSFEWEQLPTHIQTQFYQSPDSNVKDDLGEARVQYLRGDRSKEGLFRPRKRLLGNIQSTPVFKGAPEKHVSGENYSSFYLQHKNRRGTVFASANDGMLHAFSADTGIELFAYIPGPLLPKLPNLTHRHKQPTALMDGNLNVSEALVSGKWTTLLASGMGHGAKGVFALDVTAPDKFMEGKRTVFEFTEEDDADIGYVTAAPVIAKIKRDNAKVSYFVIVPSGNGEGEGENKQFLFFLSLDKHPSTPWSENYNYYKINADDHRSSKNKNLSRPGLVIDEHGIATAGYSGDLQGNLWRFDFSNLTLNSPNIIFSARDKNNNPQAITTEPVAGFAPERGYLILFGTNAKERNSFYAIQDANDHKSDSVIAGRSQLASRELVKASDTGYRISGKEFNYGDMKDPNENMRMGWFLDLDLDYQGNSGSCQEQSISKPILKFKTVFFNTDLSCDKVSHFYMVDALTGKATKPTGLKSQLEIAGSPVVVTTNPSLEKRNSIGQFNINRNWSVINFGSAGKFEIIEQGTATSKAGRLSWREIPNWQDIKQ